MNIVGIVLFLVDDYVNEFSMFVCLYAFCLVLFCLKFIFSLSSVLLFLPSSLSLVEFLVINPLS